MNNDNDSDSGRGSMALHLDGLAAPPVVSIGGPVTGRLTGSACSLCNAEQILDFSRLDWALAAVRHERSCPNHHRNID